MDVMKVYGMRRRRFECGLALCSVAVLAGCGSSLGSLNKLAASGAIHEGAPVKTKLQILIAAPPAKVWGLLIDAPGWPKWQTGIDSVDAPAPLGKGTNFIWKNGGTTIYSQVQLFEPERRLAWTGTAMTAKAVHLWALVPQPDGGTLVKMEESMDGPLMSTLYPSEKLAAGDNDWLLALKRAAEASR